jgi:anti-sigma B factor antagonist
MGDALVTSQRLADGAAIIDVRGELDVTTVSAFRTLLVDTITRQRPARVVVDMLRVTFMDSTGIGALVVGYNTAHEIGAEFVVQNPSTFVLRQLHITGLTDVFGLPSSGRPASEKTTQRANTQPPVAEEQATEEQTSERRATRRRSA